MTVRTRQSKTRRMRDEKLRRGSCRGISLLRALADLPRAQCLAPHKVRFRSCKAAETAAEKQWRADHQRRLRPYPCGDHYHLTSRGDLR